MASVHLLSAAPDDPQRHPDAHRDLEQMREAAHADRFGIHSLSEDPDAADLILFVETSWATGHYFGRVRRHPLVRSRRAKSYLFCSADKVVPFLPGVYASIERRWAWRAWTRAGGYLGVRERDPLHHDPSRAPRFLFSFVGAGSNHPVRERVLRLESPEGLVVDTRAGSEASRLGTMRDRGREAFRRRYADSIHDAAFVLCPRGGGVSSFRLFEAMMLGRSPVIVSDGWVAPEGPDWESFSIRVPEAEVESIPRIAERHAGRAEAMGEAARSAWLEWFALDVAFHRTVEWCLDLAAEAPARAGLRRYAPHLQMARPYHAARLLAKRLGHRERGVGIPAGRQPASPDR